MFKYIYILCGNIYMDVYPDVDIEDACGAASPHTYSVEHHVWALPLLAAAREDVAYKRRKQMHKNACACTCRQTKRMQTKTYHIINRCMLFMVFVAKWYSKSRFGGSGRHGPARSEKMLKSQEWRWGCFVWGPFRAHVLKSTLWKKRFFLEACPECLFSDFCRFWEVLVGHFGEVFAQILIAVWKTQHLRKHGFI